MFGKSTALQPLKVGVSLLGKALMTVEAAGLRGSGH